MTGRGGVQGPGAASGLARRPLTLLLQGQLALGLDVLQGGCQVAREAAGAVLGEQSALRGRKWGTGTRGSENTHHPQGFVGGCGPSPVWPSPNPPTTTTTLPHTQPTHCSQTLGEGLRPKVATLSWEEEEDEPEEEGSGPLRVRGRGLVASPSILER